MQHPDEGTIHAWLDGALSEEESRAIESHVAECEGCASTVAEARGLIAASSRIVSALDVVPGGVIPATKPPRAAWYTNTQLRAAAAVIIVAGASLLVMRTGKQEALMQPARPMIAAGPATVAATPPTAEIEKPIEADKEAAQSATSIALKVKKVASTAEAKARRENSQRENAADQIAPVPPPTPTAAAASEIRADAVKAAEPQRALFGKVSGVAVTSADSPELRPVRTDTTAALQRTVYQVSPGVEVTLVESNPPLSAAASVSARAAEGRVAQRTAAAPPVTNAPRDIAINSISWTSKLGRVMTLSGPVSKEELQALRLRLPAEKQ